MPSRKGEKKEWLWHWHLKRRNIKRPAGHFSRHNTIPWRNDYSNNNILNCHSLQVKLSKFNSKCFQEHSLLASTIILSLAEIKTDRQARLIYCVLYWMVVVTRNLLQQLIHRQTAKSTVSQDKLLNKIIMLGFLADSKSSPGKLHEVFLFCRSMRLFGFLL